MTHGCRAPRAKHQPQHHRRTEGLQYQVTSTRTAPLDPTHASGEDPTRSQARLRRTPAIGGKEEAQRIEPEPVLPLAAPDSRSSKRGHPPSGGTAAVAASATDAGAGPALELERVDDGLECGAELVGVVLMMLVISEVTLPSRQPRISEGRSSSSRSTWCGSGTPLPMVSGMPSAESGGAGAPLIWHP